MKTLNANTLKMLAIIAMTIDHMADLLFPNMQNNPIAIIMHIIGRITAPIMFYFIYIGFIHTNNLVKYIKRLFVFAIISHFTYCFAFGINFIPFSSGNFFNQTSIMWALAFSLVSLYIINKKKLENYKKIIIIILINIITFPADFSCIGVMIVIALYENKDNFNKQMLFMMFWLILYSIISFIFVNKTYGIIQLFSFLAYPILKRYNGQKGNAKWLKWFFYIYYPLHLLLIGIFRILLYSNVPILF